MYLESKPNLQPQMESNSTEFRNVQQMGIAIFT